MRISERQGEKLVEVLEAMIADPVLVATVHGGMRSEGSPPATSAQPRSGESGGGRRKSVRHVLTLDGVVVEAGPTDDRPGQSRVASEVASLSVSRVGRWTAFQ